MLSEMAVGRSAEQQLRSLLSLIRSLLALIRLLPSSLSRCIWSSNQRLSFITSSPQEERASILAIEWNGIHTSRNQVCGHRRSWFGMVRWLALRRVGEVPLTHTHHAQGKTTLLVSYTLKEVPREYMPTVFDSTLARMLAGQVYNQ